jgi:hypothetical protein
VSETTPNGPFEPNAVDGIAGFAQQFISEVNAPTLLDTLTAQLGPSACPFVFSMCGDVTHKVVQSVPRCCQCCQRPSPLNSLY